MAKWILQNTVRVGAVVMREGKVIDDAQRNIALIQAAGGQLVLQADAAAARQSAFASKQAKKGNFDDGRSGLPFWGPDQSSGGSQVGNTRSVRLVAMAALATNVASGTGPVVASGSDPGKGSTVVLTASANGALSIDGVAVAAGDRVALFAEGTGKNNGLYKVVAPGDANSKYVLQRADDMAQSSAYQPGMCVQSGPEGTNQGNAEFIFATAAPFTLDTTTQTWLKLGSTLENAAPLATFQKAAADGAAATATAETAVGMIGPSSGGSVGYVYYVPAAGLVADNSNYATINVFKRTAGGAGVLVAQATTQITGTNTWTAWKPVLIPIVAGAISALDSITFTITKTGTGVVVPAGQLNVYAS